MLSSSKEPIFQGNVRIRPAGFSLDPGYSFTCQYRAMPRKIKGLDSIQSSNESCVKQINQMFNLCSETVQPGSQAICTHRFSERGKTESEPGCADVMKLKHSNVSSIINKIV